MVRTEDLPALSARYRLECCKTFSSPRKTRLSITSPPLFMIRSLTCSGKGFLPMVKYVGRGTRRQLSNSYL